GGGWAAGAAASGGPGRVTPATTTLRGPAPLTERQAWAVLTWVDGLGPVGVGAVLREFECVRVCVAAAGVRVGPGGGGGGAASGRDPAGRRGRRGRRARFVRRGDRRGDRGGRR